MGEFARDAAMLSEILGISHTTAERVHPRVREKLEREPVEDFRLDFEDGYGNRPDTEEDGHAESAAVEVARGARQATLPPFIGIRIKNLGDELRSRALRTAELFLNRLLEESGGLPPNFVVTLPKITAIGQVAALVNLLARIESTHGLPLGAIGIELMVETPYSIFDERGAVSLPAHHRQRR